LGIGCRVLPHPTRGSTLAPRGSPEVAAAYSSLTRNSTTLRTYSRHMPGAPWWSRGGWRFLMCEVTLYTRRQVDFTVYGQVLQCLLVALYPKPSTPSPQPSTLKTQPSALNPQPSTCNPPPSTLNPQPSTLNPQRAKWAWGSPRSWGPRGARGSAGRLTPPFRAWCPRASPRPCR
jgi:hypothetical protein